MCVQTEIIRLGMYGFLFKYMKLGMAVLAFNTSTGAAEAYIFL